MEDGARRRNKAGERRRRTLIEAAVDLIERRGISSVRAADVSRTAGFSNSLFYWYFRDFDDLLRQAIIDARRTLRAQVAPRLAAHDDPLVKLAVMIHHTLLLVIDDPSLRVLLSSQAGQDEEIAWVVELRKTATVFMHDCELLLSEGQVLGVVRSDVPARYLSYFLRSLVHDTILSFGTGIFEAEMPTLAEDITRFSLRGVCTDTAIADGAYEMFVRVAAA